MDPDENRKYSPIYRIIVNGKPTDSGDIDPELLKYLQAMMNRVFLDLPEDEDEDDEENLQERALAAELDHLDDIDHLVQGESHPTALNWIMECWRRGQDTN